MIEITDSPLPAGVFLVLDWLDKQHAAGIPPFLLVIFAVWNGYGSWTGLRALLARRSAPLDAPPFDADDAGR